MKWMRLKMYLLPLILQEVDYITEIFINLINEIREYNNTESYTQFLDLRAEITKRIEELEIFFDENIRDVKVAYIEKARIKLKKLLMYDPDVLNKMQGMTSYNDNDYDRQDNKRKEEPNIIFLHQKSETIYNANEGVNSISPGASKMIPKSSTKAAALNGKALTKTISNTTNLTQKTPVVDVGSNLKSVNKETISKQSLITMESSKLLYNQQIPKKCANDKKQNEIIKSKIPSNPKNGSESPRKITEFQSKNHQSQPERYEDLVSFLVNDNSFIVSREKNEWKEIGFMLKLNDNEYRLLIREKANKVSLK